MDGHGALRGWSSRQRGPFDHGAANDAVEELLTRTCAPKDVRVETGERIQPRREEGWGVGVGYWVTGCGLLGVGVDLGVGYWVWVTGCGRRSGCR